MKTVVGAMLNFQAAWAAMEPAMHREPHHRPPVYPVLYIKPANTWAAGGDPIVLPAGVDAVQVGVTLGVVFGTAASRVREADALAHVAGYVVVNDVTEPHTSLLRPPMKQKCRDGFCPMGDLVPAASVANPDALTLRAFVNGEERLACSTSGMRRSVSRLIADVSEFMTLRAGDILLLGLPHGVPMAGPGDTVAVAIDGLGRIENPVIREAGAVA